MRNPDIKRSFASCVILTAIFAAFILFFSLGTLFTEDREFSEMENRNLTQMPEADKESVLSGGFSEDFESYLSDQIFLKDQMMAAKTTACYLFGKTYQNGVYFGTDGYILQRYSEDTENISSNVSYINSFAQKLDIPIDMLIVPNSVCVNSDKLPAAAVNDDQLETIKSISDQLDDSVTLFSAYDTLIDLQENQGIRAFYRTDHHWTASAARAVCDSWLQSEGYPVTSADYDFRTVQDFYGTLYSKAPASFIEPDVFSYYETSDLNVEVKYISENTFSYTFFEKSYLDKKDKYSTFFGGNFAQLKISSDCGGNEKILVLKDSYANSLIPFLAEYFSEIYVVDLRYFHLGSVSEIIAENGIDRVLMVYNVDFINEDNNFLWLE